MRVLLLLTGFSFLFLPFCKAQPAFEVQGQRGARGILPENTIPSALKAIDLGVHTLSINAVISKDGQVLVSQQPYFNNEITLSPQGKPIALKDEKKYNFYRMDYAEILKFDVGLKNHPRFPGQQKVSAKIPLLSDLIDSVEWYVKQRRLPKPDYNIETKLIPKGDGIFHPHPDEFAERIMEVVKARKLEKRVIIQSFDVRTLQYVHQNYPRVRTSLLIDEKDDFQKNLEELGFNPSIYSPYSILVGKSLVDNCHARGIRIIPWTVNTTKDILYFMDLGVDGIITDYPNLMTAVDQERPKRTIRKGRSSGKQ